MNANSLKINFKGVNYHSLYLWVKQGSSSPEVLEQDDRYTRIFPTMPSGSCSCSQVITEEVQGYDAFETRVVWQWRRSPVLPSKDARSLQSHPDPPLGSSCLPL